ncbi:MAG: SDR family oxidoreductase [Pseudomonadota bacterium]|jgi:nucleoside-diphosphate-sugar epimerase|nr:SDR family oxidoreductase [Pseudomonadota bacterium]
MNKKNILLIFGFGYTAKFMCQKFSKKNWEVFCTTRFKEKAKEIKSLNATPIFFDDEEKIESVLSKNSYILSTAPPENSKDPVVENYGHLLKKNSERVKWAGYLSTTSVYGDKKGEWVTEDTELEPNLERSISRVAAENSWIKLGENLLIKTVIFRLAGIYGPGRSLVDRLMKDEDVYIVDKPAHLFNRIHVDDIVGAIEMAISSKSEAKIFNLSDDLPAKQLDVAKFAANLLKRKSPQTVSLESDLVSEMARSFYKEEKKVSNTRLKDELGYKLVFPSFKEGLFSIHKNSKEF